MENIKIAVTIYAESTPNPAVMKFVANKMIIEGDALEYKNIEEAKASPLAYQLFHFPFIKEVFISGNFIALAKFDVIVWEEVSAELREFVRNWLHEGKKVVDESFPIETEAPIIQNKEKKVVLPQFESLGEIEQRIVQILDEYVAPAVSADGGMIRFISYEDKIVRVLLQGACSGCPSSTATLKQGISGLLQKMLPTLVSDVQAVNG